MIIEDQNVIEVQNPFNNGIIHIVKDMFDEPMLIAKEVILALGYKDTKDVVKKHLSDCRKEYASLHVSGQNREVLLINYPGMYKLSMRSQMPRAEEFCNWIANVVLPSIANTGSYEIGNSEQDQFANSILNPGMEEQNNYADPYLIEYRAKLSATIRNYCKVSKVIFPNAMKEFISTYNILYKTNLKSLTTRAFNNGLIKDNNVFDYIDTFNEYEKALGTFSYMLNRFYYLDDYARYVGEPCYGHPVPIIQPQVIYNINNTHGTINGVSGISSEDIAKFAIEKNWPYVTVQNGRPMMEICHKVNKDKK